MGDESGQVRAIANEAACCGYALCVEICPEVYQLGDDNIVRIMRDIVPQELVEKVRRAVAECPQSALAIEIR